MCVKKFVEMEKSQCQEPMLETIKTLLMGMDAAKNALLKTALLVREMGMTQQVYVLRHAEIPRK